jgi:ZIP family zinc transporter
MEMLDLLALGAVAGFTIYFGLPVARMDASARLKGMLNAASVGILLFLLVDIMGDAMEETGEKVLGALSGSVPAQSAALYAALLVGGVALGLLGLVWFEARFVKRKEKEAALDVEGAKRIALMIAIGIGLHNFSEGLAIGQSYAGGAMQLALLLVVGFGLHNATEGFGIAAPLSGLRPSWKFLALLGLIGGGPTFIGSVLGGFWVSGEASVFFLALAAGAIVYVVKELLYHGKVHGEGLASMACLVLGFFAGFGSELVIKAATGG